MKRSETTQKVYKIFISSCFRGLENARKEVFHIVINHNCLPVCMELFPSTCQHKRAYIESQIDDSDYVILLIGGLYGSIDSNNGFSFTENEYDYAVLKKKNIMVFVQQNPSLEELDETSKIKLLLFKEKVCRRPIVNYWKNEKELITRVNVSLQQIFREYPQSGFVRCPNPDCISGLKILSVDDAVQRYKNRRISSLYCICSSGITTSFKIGALLNRNNPQNNPIDIFILIRKGGDEDRIRLMKEYGSRRWNALAARQYAKLHIYCVADFSLSFRGVIINGGEAGYIGFYDNSGSSKQDSVLIVDQTSESGKYLIRYFMDAFKDKFPYETFDKAIDNA